jgi:hypothetical protein
MKHIAPSTITPARSITYVHDITGRVIASTHISNAFRRWEWISNIVAGEFECSPDDVDCFDDEQRFDNLSIGGKCVGYVSEG